MRFYVGTSGWQYNARKGVFYPEALKDAYWLSFYARHFDTIEINATFYRDVKLSTYNKWYNTVPDNSLVSVKMSKFITHFKRLRVDSNPVNRFTEHAQNLKDGLGLVLIQLPPGLKFDER
jgi:uncharacterized protein YecE (DUF72 family)